MIQEFIYLVQTLFVVACLSRDYLFSRMVLIRPKEDIVFVCMVPGLLAFWQDHNRNLPAWCCLNNECHVIYAQIHMSRNTEETNWRDYIAIRNDCLNHAFESQNPLIEQSPIKGFHLAKFISLDNLKDMRQRGKYHSTIRSKFRFKYINFKRKTQSLRINT